MRQLEDSLRRMDARVESLSSTASHCSEGDFLVKGIQNKRRSTNHVFRSILIIFLKHGLLKLASPQEASTAPGLHRYSPNIWVTTPFGESTCKKRREESQISRQRHVRQRSPRYSFEKCWNNATASYRMLLLRVETMKTGEDMGEKMP